MATQCSVDEMEKAPAYNQVFPNLFMGSKRAILDHDAGDFDVYVSTASEVKPPRSILDDFKSYHLKLEDNHHIDLRKHPEDVLELVAIARDLSMLVRSGHRVLIFCHMGMNRSGLMTALTLMWLGLTPQQAINTIRSRHGCTLSNQRFVDVIPFAYDMIRAGI